MMGLLAKHFSRFAPFFVPLGLLAQKKAPFPGFFPKNGKSAEKNQKRLAFSTVLCDDGIGKFCIFCLKRQEV
ncbi:MAG TPA: hypothetical protein H9691_02640 [Firmicutes bacterium]|nr:hypothetical protein [Bacillota bacterium]